MLLAFAYVLGGWRAAVVTAVCLARASSALGLWHDAMVTLTTTLVATVLVMILAVRVGVWMGRSRRADTVIRPLLDARPDPAAVRLPGPGAGAVRRHPVHRDRRRRSPTPRRWRSSSSPTASAGSRRPPSRRPSPPGSTRWQIITKVQLPMARPAIVLATNQGLLYVLSMVVIGGLVGAGSLGYDVVVRLLAGASCSARASPAGIAIAAARRHARPDRRAYTAARYGALTTSFARPARNVTKGTTSTWHDTSNRLRLACVAARARASR